MGLSPFHPAVRDWFGASFEGPTAAQTKGWAAIVRGESTLILAPTGSGKTLAAFLWCINRLMFEPPPASQARCRVALRLAAQGAGGRRRAQPAGADRRHRRRRRAARRDGPRSRAGRWSAPATRRPRARAVPARARRHPDHDAGVALPAAHVERARGAAQRRHRDRRRDPRARPDQARRPPRAVAGAPRGAWPDSRSSASACRPRSGRSTRSRAFSWGRQRGARAREPADRAEAVFCAGANAHVEEGCEGGPPSPDDAARDIGDEFAGRGPAATAACP